MHRFSLSKFSIGKKLAYRKIIASPMIDRPVA